MNKHLLILVYASAIFVLDACVPAPVAPIVPAIKSERKTQKVIIGERIDDRYYCLAGCCGHQDKYSKCTTAQLEEELTRRTAVLNNYITF